MEDQSVNPAELTALIIAQNQAKNWEDKWRAEHRRHCTDIETIGAALLAEAERRDWCTDFDKFVAGVNEQLNISLVTRETDYTVTMSYTVRVTQTFTAVSAEDAEDLARDRLPTFDADSNWDVYDADLVSVEAELDE